MCPGSPRVLRNLGIDGYKVPCYDGVLGSPRESREIRVYALMREIEQAFREGYYTLCYTLTYMSQLKRSWLLSWRQFKERWLSLGRDIYKNLQALQHHSHLFRICLHCDFCAIAGIDWVNLHKYQILARVFCQAFAIF